MKVHEWLSKTVESHGIYDSLGLGADFEVGTGHRPGWPEHAVESVRAMVEERGVGGTVQGDPGQKMANGWEVAEWACETFTKTTPFGMFSGRGRRFHAALDALRQADV